MSTIERCPACNAQVLVTPGASGVLRCDGCGMRFPRPRRKRDPAAWNARDDVGLGIHPALARRYKGREESDDEVSLEERPPPSMQISPSLVGEGARVLPEGAGEELEAEELAAELGADTAVEARLSTPVPSAPSPEAAPAPADPTRALDDARPNDTPVQRPNKRERERPRAKEEPLPVLEGFDLLEQVGKGAMGRVFKARETGSGRIAAVKVLAPELAARPDFVARFEREGAALARVRHPGVVAIVGSGSSGDLHYLSMDFVEGVSLRRILDAGPLPPGRALAFARQIVQGLGAAHDVGVIHRDLKPENILVEQLGEGGALAERLVLVDFGLAGIIDENEDPHPNLTKSRMTMGTVNYMAPEQRTDAKRVDQRADLYATGVILYELLTGDLPLGRFALPTERGLQLPASIDDVIVKALARAPDERYQRAGELDRDLASIEQELSRAASMDTLVGRGPATSEHPSEGPEREAAGSDASGAAASANQEAPSSSARPAAPPSRSTEARGPEWHTAPPWVKRPELLWGILALAVGAAAGLWVAPGRDAGAGVPLEAAPLALRTEAGIVAASLGGEGPPAAWRAGSEGWRTEGPGFGFDPVGEDGLSLLRAPEPLEGEVLDAAARVALTGPGEGFGALAFVDGGGQNGLGVALRSDGTCALLRLVRGKPDLETIPCDVTDRAAPVVLRCVPAERSCNASVGEKRLEGIGAAIDESWTFAVACQGLGCRFDPR